MEDTTNAAPAADQNEKAAPPNDGPKQKVYGEQIKPLLDQIMAIAAANDMSFVGVTVLDGNEDGEYRAGAIHGAWRSRDIMAFKLMDIG